MLKALLKPSSNEAPLDYTPVTTGDTIDRAGARWRFFSHAVSALAGHAMGWWKTACCFRAMCLAAITAIPRLFNDRVSVLVLSTTTPIMRPFRAHALDAGASGTADIRLIAPAHGPILRHHPRDYTARYREWPPRAWRWTPKPLAKNHGGVLSPPTATPAAWPKPSPLAPERIAGVRVAV